MTITLQKLVFPKEKFRKLKNITIPISQRITIIAGHNGIGKSTILALAAHPSGLTGRTVNGHVLNYDKNTNTTYFDKTYQANFNEIIHIDHEKDFKKKKESKSLSVPKLHYLINNVEEVVKSCRLAERPDELDNSIKAARIVARTTYPSASKFVSQDSKYVIGDSGKIPLPTIYLGLTRILPLGEAELGSAVSNLKTMHADDANLIADFMNGCITGLGAKPDTISQNKVKYTGKQSAQPEYEYSARCVSVGQDSLGSIALSLASFQKLKREWPDYPGGLLIIDELDTGLHPHAIKNLVELIKQYSTKLSLQIIATTHSPKLIELIHPDSNPHNKSKSDSVAYIRDPLNPSLFENASLEDILLDMDVKLAPTIKGTQTSETKIYFEDDEAHQFFSKITPDTLISQLSLNLDSKISPMPLGVGCDSLIKLADHDPYFNTVCMVLDADTTVDTKQKKYLHITKLPADMYINPQESDNKDLVGRPLSPERTILQYLIEICKNPEDHEESLRLFLNDNVTTVFIQEYLLKDRPRVLADREKLKKWWVKSYEYIEKFKVIENWAAFNQEKIQKYHSDLEKSLRHVRFKK